MLARMRVFIRRLRRLDANVSSAGICIPVGKDSMSMQTKWRQNNEEKQVTSPVSLIISAFAPVLDIHQTLTPELSKRPSRLILVELPGEFRRLGGAIIQQCFLK